MYELLSLFICWIRCNPQHTTRSCRLLVHTQIVIFSFIIVFKHYVHDWVFSSLRVIHTLFWIRIFVILSVLLRRPLLLQFWIHIVVSVCLWSHIWIILLLGEHTLYFIHVICFFEWVYRSTLFAAGPCTSNTTISRLPLLSKIIFKIIILIDIAIFLCC